jgi:hypothetical protein
MMGMSFELRHATKNFGGRCFQSLVYSLPQTKTKKKKKWKEIALMYIPLAVETFEELTTLGPPSFPPNVRASTLHIAHRPP